MVPIREIEDAIIAKLKADLPYLKKVEPLSEMLKMKADQLAIVVPSAFVTYVGANYSNRSMNVNLFERAMNFTILIVARSFTREKLLHGDSIKAGVYEILEDVLLSLKGQDLDLGIYPLSPVAEDVVDGSEIAAVYGITFGTRSRV